MELMKIKRVLLGEEVEIELTFDEMCDAREKIETEFMREDIEDMVGEIDPDALHDMAKKARGYVLYSNMNLGEARDFVVEEYIREGN